MARKKIVSFIVNNGRSRNKKVRQGHSHNTKYGLKGSRHYVKPYVGQGK